MDKFTRLPTEILILIMEFISVRDLIMMRRVSRHIKRVTDLVYVPVRVQLSWTRPFRCSFTFNNGQFDVTLEGKFGKGELTRHWLDSCVKYYVPYKGSLHIEYMVDVRETDENDLHLIDSLRKLGCQVGT